MIVEDDVMLAIDLAEQLAAYGYEIIGPCMTSDQALKTFEKEGCDVAVLDINLGLETSEPVARKLSDEQIPFIVASGYSNGQWPPIFKGKAAVNKPFQASVLVDLIERVG